jgi:hypothetical protein
MAGHPTGALCTTALVSAADRCEFPPAGLDAVVLRHAVTRTGDLRSFVDAPLPRTGQLADFLRQACAGRFRSVKFKSLLARAWESNSCCEALALEVSIRMMPEQTDPGLIGKQLGAYKITALLGIGPKTHGLGGPWP